jgi:hypothetical protein
MRMFLAVLLCMGLIFSLYYTNEQAAPPEVILQNMSSNGVEEKTFNITENIIPYTSLYSGEITPMKVVYNIINAIAYPMIVTINTAIPLIVYTASGSMNGVLFKLAIIGLILYFMILIPTIFKFIFILWFFIKEKRQSKTKLWE